MPTVGDIYFKASSSLVATANYLKIPHNWTISLNSKYSSLYTGSGDLALIDEIIIN